MINPRHIFILIMPVLIGFLPVYSQDYPLEKLSSDQFGFTEGPAWDGHNLYFSDIPAGKIFKYNKEEGFQLYIDNPFSTNGIVYREGVLYICESGSGRVISMDTLGNYLDVHARSYQGEFLNSPNDLTLDDQGGIYFTDPAFGFTPVITEAVYYIQPGGEVKQILSFFTKPNGILYHPDKRRIYVSDTYHKEIYSFDVSSPGKPADTLIFAELEVAEFREDDYSGADGMCFDRSGYLYVATETGIQIFDTEGNPAGSVDVPETPTNCIFGGKDNDELYITAGKNIYRVKNNTQVSRKEKITHVNRSKIKIFYNPLNPGFEVHGLKAKSRVYIYDMTGKMIYNDILNAGERIGINVSAGVYIFHIEEETDDKDLRYLIPVLL